MSRSLSRTRTHFTITFYEHFFQAEPLARYRAAARPLDPRLARAAEVFEKVFGNVFVKVFVKDVFEGARRGVRRYCTLSMNKSINN